MISQKLMGTTTLELVDPAGEDGAGEQDREVSESSRSRKATPAQPLPTAFTLINRGIICITDGFSRVLPHLAS